ncbi:MAG TPA: FAD-binding protein [Saprospiraceae bacterium]|nr:FAD-binding protein [Saprospiraceae bacterium]
MNREVEIKVEPVNSKNAAYCRQQVFRKLKEKDDGSFQLVLIKRSIDSRGKKPLIVLRYHVSKDHSGDPDENPIMNFPPVNHPRRKVIIIGAGPAGYFAALSLLRQDMQPIVIDRGKDVRTRRRDLKAIQQMGVVNPHSNYCFGEGGAGTYSDGKLYTRSHKRGNIIQILKLLIEHGAHEDILVDAHPHIGSNKLPVIVENIRNTILQLGGEVHFNTYVTDFNIQNEYLSSVMDSNGKEWIGDAFILATGHSARDIFYLLHSKGLLIERKPFALGVRIEHPQGLIDKIQYGVEDRGEYLPASSYRLACQVDDKGVFSFCMCPGGLIVPAATAPGEIVVNGMSLSRRDSPFANAGFVTSIDNDEMERYGYGDVFGHLRFQSEVEQTMFQYGDGSQKAPAQILTDFLKGNISNQLPATSYIPGIYPAPLQDLLPPYVYQRLRKGLLAFDQTMKGFLTSEAIAVGVESRTSSPIRIPRHPAGYYHPQVKNLFPCGEGAGYAGGILSAAMDGENVARALQTKV